MLAADVVPQRAQAVEVHGKALDMTAQALRPAMAVVVQRVYGETACGAVCGKVIVAAAVFAQAVHDQYGRPRGIFRHPGLAIQPARAARARVPELEPALGMLQLAFLRVVRGRPAAFLTGLPNSSMCCSS